MVASSPSRGHLSVVSITTTEPTIASSEPTEQLITSSRSKQRRRGKRRDEAWTWCYSLGCTCVALAVGFSPLVVVGVHTAWLLLREKDPQDARCSYTPAPNRSATRLVYRGESFLAMLTSADEGPRAEWRRMARLALSNKRAYAVRHRYSLYALEAARAECMRRSPGWFKLLALEEHVRQRTHQWILWMDADTFIMEPALAITAVLERATAAAAASTAGAAAGAAQPQLLMSTDGGPNAGMLLVDARVGGAACVLEHAFAMRHCLPREEADAGLPAALLALLEPTAQSDRSRACAQEHAPACRARAPPAAYAPLPPALFAPLAAYRPGHFAVHLAGCIGRRGQAARPLRSCEARLALFANMTKAEMAKLSHAPHAPHAPHAHAGADEPGAPRRADGANQTRQGAKELASATAARRSSITKLRRLLARLQPPSSPAGAAGGTTASQAQRGE